MAGNAIGPGVVLDFSRHLNQVLESTPASRTARVQAGHRAGRAAGRAPAARAAVRARPVDPHPVHDRRDDRQQLVRLADAGLRPDLGQRGRARRAHDDGRGWPRAARRSSGADRRSPRPARDRSPPTWPSRRTEFGAVRPAGLRLRGRASAARARLQRHRVPGRQRGHAGGASPRRPCGSSPTRPTGCWSCSATPTSAPPATSSRRSSSSRPTACEGIDSRICDIVRSRRGPGAVPPLPGGRPG